MGNSQQFCTFYLANCLFGIEISKVQEVLQHLELTEVPLAPSTIRGVMNLRGQIVIAVDLRRSLELPEQPPGKTPIHVVVRTAEDAVSLLVDEIGDVVEVGEQTFEPPPETLRGRVRSMILGVHQLNERLMHVLDVEKVCQITEEGESSISGR